jgi:hypothetical protein
MPGIAKYEDGTVVNWFKYERIKMLQDDLGRATQAHFAVIDTIKWNDLKSDNHSSKHICIPLTVGRQIALIDQSVINENTSVIRLKIMAEDGFDPHRDIDIKSLRFGASEEVNFGKGCEVMKTEKSGKDLIVTFTGVGNGMTENNFVAKLLGKTTEGKLLFGYARLPWINYLEPALSARLPEIIKKNKSSKVEVEVQNFGQEASAPANIKIEYEEEGKLIELASGVVPKLKPFEKTKVKLTGKLPDTNSKSIDINVTIFQSEGEPVLLSGTIKN